MPRVDAAAAWKPRGRVLRVRAAGTAVPAIAFSSSAGLARAVIVPRPWHLLANWIAGEVSLWIPHAFRARGMVLGLVAQRCTGGVMAPNKFRIKIALEHLAVASALALTFIS